MRWERISDVDAAGKSSVFPHLRGLKNGDIATSRIKQVRGRLPVLLRQLLSQLGWFMRAPRS